MKVLIDATELSWERMHASIPIYIMRFLSTIDADERANYTLLVSKAFQKQLDNGLFMGFQTEACSMHGRPQSWRRIFWEYSRWSLDRLIRKGAYDVMFVPTDVPTYVSGRLACPKVIVVHDLKCVKSRYSDKQKTLDTYHTHLLYREHIRTADAVIAISKFTKQDIQYYFPEVDAGKINVVYNSVRLTEKAVQPTGFAEENYILYVNTLQKYKNIETLVLAFVRLKDKIHNKLVVVGKDTPHWQECLKVLQEHGLRDRVVRLENITDEALRYLYEHAVLFVTPSIHEGFGYTPIEAAMCGCPVVSSIQEALPDATQGLLNYYYPAMDEVALADKIYDVLSCPPTKEQLNRIANTYASDYSLEKQSQAIIGLLRNTAKKN